MYSMGAYKRYYLCLHCILSCYCQSDVAFIHEGNDTFVNDGLVNFEKMVSSLLLEFVLKERFVWF